MKKLILFDIDGTLISVDRQVTSGLIERIVTDLLGHQGELPEHELHGKTDRQIFLELCELTGRSREEGVALLDRFDAYICGRWSELLDRSTVKVHPGVPDLLDRLSGRDDVVLGLLTGNLEPAARLKLDPHDLSDYFRFGAFGSDAVDRVDLPPIALRRANDLHGDALSYERTLIIGDSHRDIACARAWGIAALAVGTGSLSAEELRRWEPDAVCDDLSDDSFIHTFLDAS